MSNPSFLPPPPTLPPAIAAAAAAKQEELSRLALRLPEIQSHQPPPPPPHPSLNFPPKASPLRGNSSDTPASERRVAPHLNHEDDDHVDVEQCSDGEDNGGQGEKSGRSGQADKTDENEGSTGGNKKKKRKEEKVRVMKPKCNCPELMGVDCFLETKELWDKFNELGTEMIITKTGR